MMKYTYEIYLNNKQITNEEWQNFILQIKKLNGYWRKIKFIIEFQYIVI